MTTTKVKVQIVKGHAGYYVNIIVGKQVFTGVMGQRFRSKTAAKASAVKVANALALQDNWPAQMVEEEA